jgi:hypothetical protein
MLSAIARTDFELSNIKLLAVNLIALAVEAAVFY